MAFKRRSLSALSMNGVAYPFYSCLVFFVLSGCNDDGMFIGWVALVDT